MDIKKYELCGWTWISNRQVVNAIEQSTIMKIAFRYSMDSIQYLRPLSVTNIRPTSCPLIFCEQITPTSHFANKV